MTDDSGVLAMAMAVAVMTRIGNRRKAAIDADPHIPPMAKPLTDEEKAEIQREKDEMEAAPRAYRRRLEKAARKEKP